MAGLRTLVAIVLLAALSAPGHAQSPRTEPNPTTLPQNIEARIPAETIVAIELTEALSSRTSRIGQTFGLRLSEPIIVNGQILVPAGAIGSGEVIDAHAAAFGGRQGRLIISGRFLEINGERVRIHGMQVTAAGQDRVNTAMVVSMIPYAGIAGIFVQGGNVEIPAGARGTAQLATPVSPQAHSPAQASEDNQATH